MNHLLHILFFLCVLGIAHTYIIYPLTLIYFSKPRIRGKQYDTTKKIAILIAAYNEEKVIGKKIDTILACDYPSENISIYIGSDASTDATDQIIEGYSNTHKNIHFIKFEGRTGKAAIINALALNRTEDILILTDANVMFDPMAIKELTKHFTDEQTHLVCANILKVSDKNENIQPVEKRYLNLENRIKSLESDNWDLVIGAEGGCYAIRTSYYQPVPKNYFMDDFYITMGVLNKGAKVLFEPKALCYEDLPSESSEEFRRKVRISIGNYQNLSTYKHLLWPFWKPLGYAFLSHKVLRWITPFLLMGMYACSLLLSFDSLLFFEFTLLQFILFTLPLFMKQLRSIKPLLFIAHFYNMNYALLKGFFIYMKGVRSSVWEPTKRNA